MTNGRTLITFSGKYGDIIWSLATARALAATGAVIDFGVMPKYVAVVSLVQAQPYISNAFPISGWNEQHANFGAQPRIPPSLPDVYETVHHLTYTHHPTEPLILWGFRMLGLTPPDPLVPFLVADAEPEPNVVAYAFNHLDREKKHYMLNVLRSVLPQAQFENVEPLPFDQAASRIQAARFFFGCRSSNYVIAMGLGKRCLIFEPNGGRRSPVFGCPVGHEHMPDPALFHQFADLAKQWMEN